MYKRSLFIFHRDLRLHDNTALLQAHARSESVIPCFIFDRAQVTEQPYRGLALLEFMKRSLLELHSALAEIGGTLHLYYGDTVQVVADLMKRESIDAVFSNHDYTPFAQRRDDALSQLCKAHNVAFIQSHDYLLHPPGTVHKDDGKPYTVYTPFSKRALSKEVAKPIKFQATNFLLCKKWEESERVLQEIPSAAAPQQYLFGGRSEAKKLLTQIASITDYDTNRNLPALRSTSQLSPHNKFGTVSPREVFHVIARDLGREHTLIKELLWRDFFTQIAFHFPHVFELPFHRRYKDISWSNDPALFDAWCAGRTGFPIVDAGMRELNETGLMHNRVRMITGSFLVKDLHIDWRWGERYFAQKLLDYDPAVNNGNWQWVASTGCDAQPYFRIFNPWLQQEKFDEQCVYIKRWVPELKEISPSVFHTLDKKPVKIAGYPTPIVVHAEQKKITEELYEIARDSVA